VNQVAQQSMGSNPAGNDNRTPRQHLLEEAMRITHRDRNSNYGNPEDNFQTIADLWNGYWNCRVKSKGGAQFMQFNSADVAIMSMLIKVARLGNSQGHHDSAVDVAGYAACLADIQAKMRQSGVINAGIPPGTRVPVANLQQADAAMQQYARNPNQVLESQAGHL